MIKKEYLKKYSMFNLPSPEGYRWLDRSKKGRFSTTFLYDYLVSMLTLMFFLCLSFFIV